MSYGPFVPLTSRRLIAGVFPKHGVPIVFEYPNPDSSVPRQDYVKRVAAVPGDTLELDDGHPLINGWRVPSCLVGRYELRGIGEAPRPGDVFLEFLGVHAYLTWYEDGAGKGKQGPYVVQPGEVWVLGDNRHNSSDSRFWNDERGAGVPIHLVKGRAIFLWLALDANGGPFYDLDGVPQAPEGARDPLAAGIRNCLAQRPTGTVPPAPAK